MKKISKYVKVSSLASVANIALISCQAQETPQQKQINLVDITYSNITESSIQIKLEFNQKLKKNSNVKLDINKKIYQINLKTDTNIVNFNITSLNAHTMYEINNLKISDMEISLKSINNKSFKTNKKEILENNLLGTKINDVKMNSASINFIFAHNITQNKKEITLTINSKSVNVKKNSIDKNILTAELDNLNINTIYTITNLNFMNQKYLINLTFQTLKNKIEKSEQKPTGPETSIQDQNTNEPTKQHAKNPKPNKPEISKPTELDKLENQLPKEPNKTINTEDNPKIQNETSIPGVYKKTNEYGNVYDLQKANLLQKNEINIKNSDSFNELNKNNLITKHNFYTQYFNVLENYNKKEQVEKETTLIEKTNMVDIDNITIGNNHITLNLSNQSNQTITSAVVLVKSFDHHNPWSKYINLNINNGLATFSKKLLNNSINKYIITEIIINKEFKQVYNIATKYKFKTSPQITNLNLENFDIYKNENSKEIFATAGFNLTNEQWQILYDKVFVFYFEVKPKVFTPEKDLFDQTINNNDNFDEKNTVQTFKKIYIPFKQLQKFSLAAFQEQILYKLKYIDVVNSGSYLNFLDRIDISNKNIAFAYNFDWNNSNIHLKDQLYENDTKLDNNLYLNHGGLVIKQDLKLENNKENAKTKINFSIKNFANLLDFNYDFYNLTHRFANNNFKQNKKDFTLFKNSKQQDIHWFKTRDYLNNAIFKINDAKTEAVATVNLNDINMQTSVNDEDVIFWFVFELDLNPRKSYNLTEINDIPSRVRVPVSLKNIKQKQQMNNIDFLFDYIAEDNLYQQSLYQKIKNKIQFNLIFQNNRLSLQITSRNSNFKFYDNLTLHNFQNESGGYINRFDFFVNWVQDKKTKTKQITYQQQKKLDANSLLGESTAYNNTYELKASDYSANGETTPKLLEELPKKEDRGKRLFKEAKSVALNESRSRAFSIEKNLDGTWNIFAKVNDNPNDYRFYAFVNYHVWDTLINQYADLNKIAKKTVTKTQQKIEFTTIDLIAPTLINKPVDLRRPVYTDQNKGLSPEGNIFTYHIPNDKQGIIYNLFIDFSRHFNNDGLDTFKDNFAEVSNKTNIHSKLDTIMVIIDFKTLFEEFQNKNLETYIYQEKLLTQQQKDAIQHFLNFKNLKPLKLSSLSMFLNSFNNLNFYISTLPKTRLCGENPDCINKDTAYGLRYREYIIGNNPIQINDSANIVETIGTAISGLVEDFDWFSGSSGSGVYDYQGNLIGLDNQGGSWSSNGFLVFDTPQFAHFGNSELNLNPRTFYEIIKKLAYLYPNKYKDIFKER
ncbi:hypothetical protein BCF59_0286 [Mycoplasmopsis mustelae]|uniref:Lipoprotein n=1 Tax=Mycoplasmopsis mustelae TaxID=171289 RepID=A0A4R7UE23_9BACT|nr:hypothetical protein [Mycoplasmopsis mustelae]TDV24326.1 hypothetical protein BCF59_0286 [Mycoplasmopsis mustelae]